MWLPVYSAAALPSRWRIAVAKNRRLSEAKAKSESRRSLYDGARLERLEAGELVGVLVDQLGEALHDRDALRHELAMPAPVGERGTRGRDGKVDVRLRAGRDAPDQLPGGRAADLQPLAGASRRPAPRR